MARYCVTGASGFIGASLVARLKAQGHWVRAVDVKVTAERRHLYEQADELMAPDLRKPAQAIHATADVDRVFHLAADHGGAGYFYGPADFKAANNNLTIDRNVLLSAMGNGVDRLFFASSACTYPTTIQGKDARPLRESDWGGGPAEALYGEAKRMSTLLMEGSRDHGFDARSGIFHTIYGPTQDTEEPRAKFPTAICRKILQAHLYCSKCGEYREDVYTCRGGGKSVPKVEIWGDGTQVRTFLYIDDALDRIQAVMEQNYSGPVNVGSDEQVMVQQCCEWAAEAAHASPEWVYVDGPTGVAHRAADNTEFDKRYGRGELTSAEEGFGRLLRWMEGARMGEGAAETAEEDLRLAKADMGAQAV